jgi:ribose 5-phosphate isomerase A
VSAIEDEKRAAAEQAAELVEDGMTVGLGTGTTVAYLLPVLAARRLNLRCVATSPRTEQAARELGFSLEPFDALDRLDLTIDGADQIDPAGWLVKGGGSAHTREKVVAAASDRFVVIGSSDKLVEAIAPPVPLELLPFGVRATLRALGPAERRDVPPSPDGGLIADYLGPVEDPADLADRLAAVPGVVEHGLFSPELVSEILVARDGQVERILP